MGNIYAKAMYHGFDRLHPWIPSGQIQGADHIQPSRIWPKASVSDIYEAYENIWEIMHAYYEHNGS